MDTFRLDVKGTQVVSALGAAGVETILLKGPAFDQLLFGGARSRVYADIDLLIDPNSVAAAERLLGELGFQRGKREWPWPAQLARFRPGAHATAWVRDADRFTVDLHITLPAVGVPAALVWPALLAHRTTIEVVEVPVRALDAQASALLIALHAAHHGPDWRRAQTDLRRACELLDQACWEDAARLARELRAGDAMGIGLGMLKEGVVVADELGLRTKPTVAQRLKWSSAGWLERWRAANRGRR